MAIDKLSKWWNPADWFAPDWDSMDDQQRTQFSIDQYAKSGRPESFFQGMISDDIKNNLRNRARQQLTPERMMSGGLEYGLGLPASTGGWKGALKNWKTYAPLAAGAGAGLYGLATGNKGAMAAGLAGVGYGAYDLYNAYNTLQDKELQGQALGGEASSPRVREAARKRMAGAYGKVSPLYNAAKGMGLNPGSWMKKQSSSYSDRFRANFLMADLVDELNSDRSLDPRTAAELIVAGKRAQRMDNTPSTSLINVGQFAQSAANGFGFQIGATIGSLMTLAPAIKSTIRRIGFGGLFTGAKALGVFK